MFIDILVNLAIIIDFDISIKILTSLIDL